MPDKIMSILAEVTGGKSYKAHKYGLDHADRPFIDYGEDSIIWKKTAETDKTNRKYVPLEGLSKKLSAREEQLLTYFLDGSRRVFKVDDIAYTKSRGRSVIYPVVAGQIGVGCCKRENKRMIPEKFKREFVLSIPDIANADGKAGFFPATARKLNESPELKRLGIEFATIIPYRTAKNAEKKFEDLGTACIQDRMSQREKDLVAELVREGKLNQDNRQKNEKLSEINIRPLRIAFDHYEQREVYIAAVKRAAKYGIMELSNYLLYNFEDEPKELYYRMRLNVDLCEELGVTIYSFPMKYHPISDPAYFKNRDYLGERWNRKFIRAVQAVLNSTKGKIGKGVEFFEEAFGRDLDEFYKILWMPETFIIYRRKYDQKLRERLADRYKNHWSEDCDLANEWWIKFCSLPAEKLEIAKSIISLNKFKEGDYECTDKEILDVLSYYSITRDIAEGNT